MDNLGQIKWNIETTPPPKISDGKMARFGLHAPSSLIWGEGAFLFHFILSKIVVFDATMLLLVKEFHITITEFWTRG